jgi:hypothetical protein
MFNIEDYTVIAHLFPRLLGFIYFFAFGAFIFQIKGLIGSQGILPVTEYLNAIRNHYGRRCYYKLPSLFWINSSDTALLSVVVGGTVLSIFLILGIYPAIMLLLLYFLYLSIDSVGQDFLSFGWEGFLLETTFYAFLLSLTDIPNFAVWIGLNLLLFRFHFQAGAVKIQSGDMTWRDMSALSYHYQTQPLPNTAAWYIHKMPMWFHKASSFLMFIFELILPFGIFLTEDIRNVVFIGLFGLQLTIWATGNFSYLNHLTMVLTTILLNNNLLLYLYPFQTVYSPTPLYLDIVLTLIGSLFTALQLLRLWTHFFPDRDFIRWLDWLAPFNLICRYGIFAVMTTKRYEIIIEGSDDNHVWKEYLFKFKPSEISRRPRRVSPYQPRIDWQIWFLPFTSFNQELWFQLFLLQLLKGNPVILKLLRGNPFPNQPPKYIRALAYEYTFTSFAERRETGNWWSRHYIGEYSPTLSLKN